MVLSMQVRLALPGEAAAITACQLTCWAGDPLTAELVGRPDAAAMTSAWRAAILRPPLASFRVLVALAEGQLTGFCAVGPDDDEDADPSDGLVGEFQVLPAHRHQGHGSRLMQAAVDTLRADGFEQAHWWLGATDEASRAFLSAAGWQPDGAFRSLTTAEGRVLKQIRMHTLITGPAGPTEAASPASDPRL